MPSESSAPTAPPCPADGVVITAHEADAAMGLRVLSLRMRNCGTTPYAVHGYPDLKLLDEDGDVLDVDVRHGSEGISRIDSFEAPPREITLQPGDTASTGLVWRNTYDDTTNPPRVGTRIDIAPTAGRPRRTFVPRLPADGEPWRENAPAVTIDLGSTGRLGVSPWTTP
ncbi:DUF4232 domain-containing protein [Saccharothrix australiensis]|uniref:DUF4232 domain-containing protein n=1 Tax=Saccharothrix australiensis TaxID=2072 RepID=UPI001FEB3590|nr:DUF4232 domain-containing protein [Saccharothrix australiensis]